MTYAALIQPVLWAIAGGACAFYVSRAILAWRRKGDMKKPLRAVAIALVAVFIAVPAIGVVPAGNRGVVYRWDGGIDQKARGEGVTFLIPWVQHLTTSSVRTQKVFSKTIFAQSADLQEITVVGSVNFHVDPQKAPYLYQRVGPNYASIVIQPALFQRLKAAVGQVKAVNFASKRDKLANKVAAQLRSQLSGYGIVVEYVNIEDAIFDPNFVKAVKDKIIAIQQAKEQHNLIAARRAVKTQTIIDAQASARAISITAKGQAAANRRIAESVTPELLKWQWLVVWNGSLPSTLVGSNAMSLFLNAPTTPGSVAAP